MRTFTAAEVRVALPWSELVDAIAATLERGQVESPDRNVFTVPDGAGGQAALLLMPAWEAGAFIGVKAVTYFPSNSGSNFPTINAGYLLFDGRTGQLAAVLDGDELTARRTAAASALAARSLARVDAERLLVVGTGQLAPAVAQAHAVGRHLTSVEVWGRNEQRAQAVVDGLDKLGLPARVSTDLDGSVATADIISTVTGSNLPLLRGALLTPGTHVDLIGSFNSEMRESDDVVIQRGTIFVDTRVGALQSGDLAQPLANNQLTSDDIVGDLSDLVKGRHRGRVSETEITVYKSAGFALLDLAAACLAFNPAG